MRRACPCSRPSLPCLALPCLSLELESISDWLTSLIRAAGVRIKTTSARQPLPAALFTSSIIAQGEVTFVASDSTARAGLCSGSTTRLLYYPGVHPSWTTSRRREASARTHQDLRLRPRTKREAARQRTAKDAAEQISSSQDSARHGLDGPYRRLHTPTLAIPHVTLLRGFDAAAYHALTLLILDALLIGVRLPFILTGNRRAWQQTQEAPQCSYSSLKHCSRLPVRHPQRPTCPTHHSSAREGHVCLSIQIPLKDCFRTISVKRNLTANFHQQCFTSSTAYSAECECCLCQAL